MLLRPFGCRLARHSILEWRVLLISIQLGGAVNEKERGEGENEIKSSQPVPLTTLNTEPSEA